MDECPEGRLWVVVEGWVYDLSGFEHPGGAVLEHFAGVDVTPWLLAVHARHGRAFRALSARAVGPLKGAPVMDPLDREWLALFHRYVDEGLFRFEARVLLGEVFEMVFLMALGLVLIDSGWTWSGFFVLTCGSARWGFHNHDSAHGECFETAEQARFDGRWVGAAVWGLDFYTGGAVQHFLHHATPNVAEVDGAIDMRPLVRWHPAQRALFPLAFAERGSALASWPQVLLWYGVIIWLVYPLYVINGVLHVASMRQWAVLALIVARHAAWPLLGRHALPLLLSAFAGMAYFAVIASAQHFAMPISHDVKNPLSTKSGTLSFVRTQAPRIRDTHAGRLADWLLGHFTLHTAHHLFPVMPRRNLNRIQPDIVSLLRKDGYEIDTTSFLSSIHHFNHVLTDPLHKSHILD